MREILQFHVGQAGIQIGNTAWELLCLEHGIQPDGSAPSSQNLQVLFSESQTKANVPRAAFFDDDPLTINSLNRGPLKKVLNQNLIKLFKDDASSIWASKKITQYDEKDRSSRAADEIVRKMLEAADAASAIIIYHSLAGGFGSGFTCKLLQLLNDETAKTTKLTVSINYLLNLLLNPIIQYSLCQHFQNCQISIFFMIMLLYFETPNFSHLNYMIAQTISSISQSIRFRGTKLVDFNDMRTNLITTPKQQFLWTSYSPFIYTDQQHLKKPNLQNITESLFDDNGHLLSFNRLTHKYLGSSLFFKGDCPLPELNYVIKQIKQSEEIRFAEGTQVAYQTCVSMAQPCTLPNYPFAKYSKTACMLAHSTGVLQSFESLKKRFSTLYSKRAFVSWYVGQGLEEGQFSESNESLQQIIELYKGKHGDGKPIEVQPKTDRKQEYGYKKEKQAQQQPQVKKTQEVKKTQDVKKNQAPKASNQITTARVENNDYSEDAYDQRAPARAQQKPLKLTTNDQKQSNSAKPNRIQQEDDNIVNQPQQQEDDNQINEPQEQEDINQQAIQQYDEEPVQQQEDQQQNQDDGFGESNNQQPKQNDQKGPQANQLNAVENISFQ
uniref:Alpha tubulin,putative n=1 Tax=Paramecium tetraurelia TaxID=5888 RepID=Q3SEG9_PARTE|nr:alpha tubulin,putative [Paramecium tetraurelia]